MCGQGDLLTFENEKYVVQAEPAILILEFGFIGNESPITLPFVGRAFTSYLSHKEQSSSRVSAIISEVRVNQEGRR